MSKNIWTDDRITDLHRRWREGQAPSAIARAYSKDLGRPITRNAIIGKVHRSMPRSEVMRPKASAPKAARAPRDRKAIRMPAGPISTAISPGKMPAGFKLAPPTTAVAEAFAKSGQAVVARFEVARPGLGVSLMALEEAMCKRPSGGAGADTIYCGNPTERRRGRYDSFCSQCKETLVDGRRMAQRPRNDSLSASRGKTLPAAPRWG